MHKKMEQRIEINPDILMGKPVIAGTRIPIYHPDRIRETRPDYVLILPWNLKDEIMEQMAHVKEWGGKFVVFIPEVRIYP